MAYLGLVPTEDTSSERRRQGHITKCGNSHVRWLLVECAQHYAAPPKVSKELSRRQEGQSQQVRAISWRAQNRLHQRYTRLLARRLQRNKAIVAIARESFCGFIWELLRPQPCYEAISHYLSKGGQILGNSHATNEPTKEEKTEQRRATHIS